MNALRVILIIVLLLSLFITAKSFIAVYNVREWSDDLRGFIVGDMLRPTGQRNPVQFYETRLDAIQGEWTILRYVGAASAVLSCIAIYLASRRPRTIAGCRIRMSTVAQTIRRLREQVGISPQEMAKLIWMNAPSYYDLEAVPDEWEQTAELSQLLELSRILGTPLLDLLGETEAEVREPLSFPELAAFIRREITNGRTIEDRIGWDLSEFWEEPMIAMEYPVSFLKIVGEDVGFDWRRPLLYYQRNAERGAPPNGGPAQSVENSNGSGKGA